MNNNFELFEITQPDIHGYVPDTRLIGKMYKHANGFVYYIVGFSWLGDMDEWLITHKREGCDVLSTRGVHNFFHRMKEVQP